MLTPPYPLHPAPMQRSWLEQHPCWKIPLGGLTLFFLIGIFASTLITIITMSFHWSDVYKQALAKAADSPQVREQIGEPIKAVQVARGECRWPVRNHRSAVGRGFLGTGLLSRKERRFLSAR